MFLAALGLIINWQWAQYAYFLLAFYAITGWLKIFSTVWHFGGPTKTPNRGFEDIFFGILTILFFLASSIFIYFYFRKRENESNKEIQNTNLAAEPFTTSAEHKNINNFTFHNIMNGLFFSFFLITTFFLLPEIYKQSIQLVMMILDNLGLNFIKPIVVVVLFVILIVILVLSKVVESGFSLHSLLNFKKKNADN